MDAAERVRAELEVLGLDASRHVMDFYAPVPRRAGRPSAPRALLEQRSRAELLVAGVKVATQTPPIRSGRRVVFLTLDDGTGPVDATFFEDALGPYATTVFHSWLLVVRGELRRTGRRGVSLRATGCWELQALHDAWRSEGMEAVHELIGATPAGAGPRDQAGQAGGASEEPGHAGCWCTRPGSGSRRTPTSSRPARQQPPRASSGTPRRGARAVTGPVTAPGSALGWAPCRLREEDPAPRTPASGAAPPAPPWSGRRSGRSSDRSAAGPAAPGPRHRRRHRRVRGPGGRARPPRHRGRPQPGRPGDPRPPLRGVRCRRPGHRRPG